MNDMIGISSILIRAFEFKFSPQNIAVLINLLRERFAIHNNPTQRIYLYSCAYLVSIKNYSFCFIKIISFLCVYGW
jgi:hypothetical protein